MIRMLDPTLDILIWILIILISSSFHELSHAWSAYKCGDLTAKTEGRITLNPMAHIGLFETILLPTILFIATKGAFVFGGAKPVPVNYYNLRKPERDMAITSAAGPLANFILVIIASILLFFTKPFYGPIYCLKERYLIQILQAGLIQRILINFIFINLILGLFNLVPIPPLDGSRVIRYFFPALRDIFSKLDEFGLFIIMPILFLFPQLFTFIVIILFKISELIIRMYNALPM